MTGLLGTGEDVCINACETASFAVLLCSGAPAAAWSFSLHHITCSWLFRAPELSEGGRLGRRHGLSHCYKSETQGRLFGTHM